MPDHTPEPWEIVDGELICPEQWPAYSLKTVARIEGKWGRPERDALADANARRIVACVNACADIPTEALQNGIIEELIEQFEFAVKSLENTPEDSLGYSDVDPEVKPWPIRDEVVHRLEDLLDRLKEGEA